MVVDLPEGGMPYGTAKNSVEHAAAREKNEKYPVVFIINCKSILRTIQIISREAV